MRNANELVVLDWAEAYTGNPLSDVARTYLILTSPHLPSSLSPFVAFFAKAIKNQICAAYLKEYFKITATSWEAIEAWLLPVAAGRLEENISDEKEWLLQIIDQKLKLL